MVRRDAGQVTEVLCLCLVLQGTKNEFTEFNTFQITFYRVFRQGSDCTGQDEGAEILSNPKATDRI